MRYVSRVVAALQLAALAGCTTARPAPELIAGPRTGTIFLVKRGWHTDIGIGSAKLDASLAPLRTEFPGAQVFLIGFGERAYLLHRDHDFGDMLAALIPGAGALLVTGLRTPPQAAFPAGDVVTLAVSDHGLARLNAYLAQAFERASNGAPRLIAPGPYAGSEFYAARATYSGFFTCNTWTAAGLRTAGLPIRADGVLFADDVADQARAAARRQADTEPSPGL